MSDTLGLLEESRQLARDLGYRVREEPLGDLLHALCTIVEVIRDNADDILERLKG